MQQRSHISSSYSLLFQCIMDTNARIRKVWWKNINDEPILCCAAIISSNRQNKKSPDPLKHRNSNAVVSLIFEFLADSSAELSSVYLRLSIATRCSRGKKKEKKKSRLNDDHWYKRRVTRGNVQIGCSCKCQMVEWIVGRMVTATFFSPEIRAKRG